MWKSFVCPLCKGERKDGGEKGEREEKGKKVKKD